MTVLIRTGFQICPPIYEISHQMTNRQEKRFFWHKALLAAILRALKARGNAGIENGIMSAKGSKEKDRPTVRHSLIAETLPARPLKGEEKTGQAGPRFKVSFFSPPYNIPHTSRERERSGRALWGRRAHPGEPDRDLLIPDIRRTL